MAYVCIWHMFQICRNFCRTCHMTTTIHAHVYSAYRFLPTDPLKCEIQKLKAEKVIAFKERCHGQRTGNFVSLFPETDTAFLHPVHVDITAHHYTCKSDSKPSRILWSYMLTYPIKKATPLFTKSGQYCIANWCLQTIPVRSLFYRSFLNCIT